MPRPSRPIQRAVQVDISLDGGKGSADVTTGPAFFAASADAAIDPYFSSVVLLLHGEGADGSQTFTDHSSFGKTVTVSGGTAVSTTGPKYGTGSIKGVTNGYISAALGSEGTMTGDFTIELWSKNTGNDVLFFNSGGNYLYNGIYQDYGGPALSLPTYDNTLVWSHLAISRVGSTMRSFKNGALIDSQTYSGTVNLSTMIFGYYVPSNILYYQGYYDDIRVTKGVGRYTAGFTPPTAEFPNS